MARRQVAGHRHPDALRELTVQVQVRHGVVEAAPQDRLAPLKLTVSSFGGSKTLTPRSSVGRVCWIVIGSCANATAGIALSAITRPTRRNGLVGYLIGGLGCGSSRRT